jgi:hypothetical protein
MKLALSKFNFKRRKGKNMKNGHMIIDEEDLKKLSNDEKLNIMLTTMSYTRKEIADLNDKIDKRKKIDNIFAVIGGIIGGITFWAGLGLIKLFGG